MYHEQTMLVDRDGWLYVRYQSPQYDKPVLDVLFYPLGIRTYDFRRNWLGNEEPVERELRYTGTGGVYTDSNGLRWRLKDGGATVPVAELCEHIAIPEPKQRGKKCMQQFRQGRWYRLTQRGWLIA